MTTLSPRSPAPRPTDPGSTIAPDGTGSRGTRILGWLVLAGSAVGAVLGLVVSEPDVIQGDAVRLFYVHVPVVSLMYLPVGACAIGSVMWLRKRTDGWDALAAASAHVATLFVALGLVTGMLWGRITWGTYWTWDARLTSTALLFVLLLGYLALRRYPAEPEQRSRIAAIVGLLLVPNAIIVHYSVEWWRSLHQGSTLKRLDVQLEGSHLATYGFAQAVFALVLAWLLLHRFRVEWLQIQADRHELDAAVAQRSGESDASAAVEGSA